MLPTTYRQRQRAEAQAQLTSLTRAASNVYVVHYSCESFVDGQVASSPRVTSLALRRLDSGETLSYSLHLIAEELHQLDTMANNLDAVERELLTRFFHFVETHPAASYLHWNMRDTNYGFPALSHRARVLGVEPVEIPPERKFNLADVLENIFGRHYVEDPKLFALRQLNNITDRMFLTGAQEAEAFEKGEFLSLHQSTLRKVEVIASIANRAAERRLVTTARWRDMYGVSIHGLFDATTDHSMWKAASLMSMPLAFILAALNLWQLFS